MRSGMQKYGWNVKKKLQDWVINIVKRYTFCGFTLHSIFYFVDYYGTYIGQKNIISDDILILLWLLLLVRLLQTSVSGRTTRSTLP